MKANYPIFEYPLKKFNDTIQEILNRGNNKKDLNMDQNYQMQKEFSLLGVTMSSVAKNLKFNSKELDGTMDVIKKAQYDIDKMPKNYTNIVDMVYNDLKGVTNLNTKYYDNTFAKSFIDIYETVHSDNYKKFVKDFQKDSKSFSGESFDMCDPNYFSNENWFTNLMSKVNLPKLKEVFKISVNAPVIVNGLGSLTTVAIISTIVISCLLVVLLVYSILYTRKKTNYLGIEDNDKITSVQRNAKYVEEIEEETKNNAEKYLLKPMDACLSFIKKLINNKDFSTKKLFSKENYENELLYEDRLYRSTEWFMITSIAIAGLLAIVPLARGFIYYIAHLKLRLHTYFDEQYEILSYNIDSIYEQIENTQDPKEKERLEKIVEKQRKHAANFRKYSDNLYNECVKASYAVDDNLDNDEDTLAKYRDLANRNAGSQLTQPANERESGSVAVVF